MDKLLPIESFYTIGTFVEFVDKLLMPSLIIQNEKIISLEVWPYSMDMLHDCEHNFNNIFASHWYYHMYDNHIVLFMHMKQDEEDSSTHAQDATNQNKNIRIDINISPITFKSFFVHIEDNIANNLGKELESIDYIVEDQADREKKRVTAVRAEKTTNDEQELQLRADREKELDAEEAKLK
jgi:hypothetical protein